MKNNPPIMLLCRDSNSQPFDHKSVLNFCDDPGITTNIFKFLISLKKITTVELPINNANLDGILSLTFTNRQQISYYQLC